MQRNYNVLPQDRLIIGYTDIFPEEEVPDRISLLNNISRLDIMMEIAGVNFKLKGNRAKFINVSFRTQLEQLFHLCGKNRNLYKTYYDKIILISKTRKKNPFIFTRQACLFALEEITQSDLPIIDDFKMSTSLKSWENLLKYILLVNTTITNHKKDEKDQPIDFETLNPKLIPISELMLFNDPFYNVFRGYKLMEFLFLNAETKKFLTEHLQEKFQLDYRHFTFLVYSMWMANNHVDRNLEFFYQVPLDHPHTPAFIALSGKYSNDEYHKLLNIRKNPFCQIENGRFILTDFSNLLDLTFGQFLNDLWFDKIKGNNKSNGSQFKYQDYRSIFGSFFEEYVKQSIGYSFRFAKNYFIKTFNELKIIHIGSTEIECGDIYIRSNNKVILGEVKSASIYDDSKYSGDVNILYKNNREKFFNDFGIDQLVKNLKDFKENLNMVDSELASLKKIRIWPIIIFNEKCFQTPLMAEIFNARFKEVIGDHKFTDMHIYPLTLLHVSDLENIESYLHSKPDRIWQILTNNFQNGVKFIPPFYSTLNRLNIKAGYKRIYPSIIELLNEFGLKSIK